MFKSIIIFKMVQDKHQLTFLGSQKLMYALSIEIMTLTLKVTVTEKHAKMQTFSETGLHT